MSRPLLAAVLVAMVSRPTIGIAQADPRLGPPTAVADSFFRATRDARWVDAARFLDLDAVASMRDGRVRNARTPQRDRKITAETILEFDPKMPREVAEYQARQHNERVSERDFLLDDYARVPSIDSLAALSPLDVAARWLEAKDERWAIRRAMLDYQKRVGCPPTADSIDAVIAAIRPPAARIIGTVVDDSIAFVLHERALDSAEVRSIRGPGRSKARNQGFRYLFPPSVTTLRLGGGAWRIVPGFETGGQSAQIDRMACTPAARRNDR
jgi:hypothetical protein